MNDLEAIVTFAKIGSISGLVAEYIVAIDVTRARFPADAHMDSMLESRIEKVEGFFVFAVWICFLHGHK